MSSAARWRAEPASLQGPLEELEPALRRATERLATQGTLNDAISNGTSNLNWSQETFAYADAHNGDTWVGVSTGEHVNPSPSGLLIHPDHVPARDDERGEGGAVSGTGEGESGGMGTEIAGDSEATASSFYALFELDPVRAIRQLGDILEHVTGRLGADVELSLELRARNSDGYSDTDQRIVTENANNLGAQAAEFE